MANKYLDSMPQNELAKQNETPVSRPCLRCRAAFKTIRTRRICPKCHAADYWTERYGDRLGIQCERPRKVVRS